MEGRGKSRRRNPYQTWKRRASAMLAVLLTLSLVLGDISGLSRTVMAGQRSVKEEFRIHREAILKAAEEAIEKEEPLSQPLAITSDEEKTETKYQELLAADGTVYEIFPEIEQVQDVDSLELRVFIRLEEGADPASYTLTGEEELIFLYVNGGGVAAEGRVNIDGYVSDFIEVEPLEEDDAVWAVGNGNAGGNGNAAGSGSVAGTVNDNGNDESNRGVNEDNEVPDTMAPEDSAADLTQSADEEEEDKIIAPESSQKPEDTLPAETEEIEEAEEIESDKKEDAGKPEQNPAESGADASAETKDNGDEKETAGSADKDATDKDVTGDTEKEEDTDNSEKEDETEVAGNVSEDEDKNVGTSDADKDDKESNKDAVDTSNTSDSAEDTDSKDTNSDDKEISGNDTGDVNDAEGADEKNDTGSAVTVSLRQIQRVAVSLASGSDAGKEMTGSNENGSNGSGSNGTGSTGVGNKNSSNGSGDDEDSYYENTDDPFDEEDAAALEDEESVFKKVKKLDGIRYDEAVLDEVLAIRAFVVSMEDAGFDKEEILEGAHHLTYTVSEGEARVVYNPEYVRDEAVVTFGIIPAEGMEVYQVTANGEALAETEKTAAIASASEAKRASSSDADVDEERAVYYQIPRVLEDQDVQIQVVEEGYNAHPAFHQSRTVNGVTVTVSAEEGILPAGTELSVEEVTEQVANAVVEKVEAEAAESSDTIAARSLDRDEREDGGETLSVTEVIAYDINLMLDGKKLNNDYWGKNNVVMVTFSGDRIEQASQKAEKIQIAVLETPTETVEAALGGTEEMPVVENLTAEDIQIKTEGREPIDVSGENAVRKIETEVSHFTVLTIAAYAKKPSSKTVTFYAGYENDAKFSDGNISKTVTVTTNTVGDRMPEAPTLEGAAFRGWVYDDKEFNKNTSINGGEKVYALFHTDFSAYKENHKVPTDEGATENPGEVTAKKTATWVDYENGLARIDLSVEGKPKQTGTDVIIILDKSGSMSTRLSGDDYPERMGAARNAAKNVIDVFLTKGSKNRVAYIPFSSGEPVINNASPYVPVNHTESYVGFQTYDSDSQNNYLEYAINATDAYGGTSYHDALNMAKELLQESGNDKNEKSVIIFISDGAPNKKYDYVDDTNKNDLRRGVTKDNSDPRNVAEAIRNSGVDIYSVGIQIDDNAASVLKNISAGKYYSVANLEDLKGTLETIAGKIQLAGTAAELKDVLSEQFRLLTDEDFQNEKLNLSQYNLTSEGRGIVEEPGDAYTIANNTVTFTVGDITATPQNYQIYVRIKDEYMTPDGSQFYPTNASVTLTYTDIDGNPNQTKKDEQIGVPELDRYGRSIEFRKVLGNSQSGDFSNVKFELYRANEKGEFVEDISYKENIVFSSKDNSGIFTGDKPVGVLNTGTAVYYLKEQQTVPGYTLLPGPIKITLEASPLGPYVQGTYPNAGNGTLGEKDKTTITPTMSMGSEWEDEYLKYSEDNGKGIWKIINYPGAELPETGGPGLIMMERFGWMLLLLAMLGAEIQIYGSRRKREE